MLLSVIGGPGMALLQAAGVVQAERDQVIYVEFAHHRG
jgi:hypothetical protein